MKKVNKIFMFLSVLLFLAANFIFVSASSQKEVKNEVLYTDNYAEALHEIRNHSDFKITIGAEYYFIVEDKETGEKYQRNIRSDRSKEFEQYCKDDLNIDLNNMLPKNVVQVKYFDEKKTRGVISDKGVTDSDKIPQYLEKIYDDKEKIGVIVDKSPIDSGKILQDSLQSEVLSASNDTQNNPYQVTFNVNGGVGNNTTMDAICSYKLPSFTGVSFKPSAGKEFIGWSRSASGPVITGENIIISGSTMLYAIWDDACSGESTTEALKEYPLTSCPDGAICAYSRCSGRYKVDHCQDDYEYQLQDGTCKCHKELHMTGILSGNYKCDPSWGSDGDNVLYALRVYMENLCNEYEAVNGNGVESGCVSNYDYRGPREVFWLFDRIHADSLGIADIESYSNKIDTLHLGNIYGHWITIHHGYRDGVDSEYDQYNHQLYLTKTGCVYIGEKYFSSGFKGQEIDLLNDYSDKACKQDCTGFDLDACPVSKKCLVCGDKFKVVGEEKYENKGWKCYKIINGEMVESDECNCEEYKNKSKDGTMLTSEEPGCSADSYMCEKQDTKEKFYSGVCGGCLPGYKMGESGKCVYIPCDGSYWMEVQMNLACSDDDIKNGTCDDNHIRPTKEFVPMNGCTQTGKQFCEKHFGNDLVGGFPNRDANDGCTFHYSHTYFKCTECEDGYDLIDGACVAKSGVGSIYYYRLRPIGIVFEETDDAIKLVSFENLGFYRGTYSFRSYRWEDAMAEVGLYTPKHFAPEKCVDGSICGKGKWRLPTVEEMQKISEKFDDGGPLLQATRVFSNYCSQENPVRLPSNRYWTSTTAIQKTNTGSIYGGADIDAAYVVYHPSGDVSLMGKKNSISPSRRYARPVLVIQKNNTSGLSSLTLTGGFSSSVSLAQ